MENKVKHLPLRPVSISMKRKVSNTVFDFVVIRVTVKEGLTRGSLGENWRTIRFLDTFNSLSIDTRSDCFRIDAVFLAHHEPFTLALWG